MAAIEITRVYGADDAKEFLAGQGEEMQRLAHEVDGKFASGFIRAVKPLTAMTVAPVAEQGSASGTARASCCG